MADAKSTPAGSPPEGPQIPSAYGGSGPDPTAVPAALAPLLDPLEDSFLAGTVRDPILAAYGILSLARLRAALRKQSPDPAEVEAARALGRWLGAELARKGGDGAEARGLADRFRREVDTWAEAASR